MVVFDGVGKRYGDKAVLDSLSFTILRNEFAVLAGASGAGKSTVLRLIAAIDRPTTGSVVVAGQPLARMRRRAVSYLRRSMGIVLQDLLLLDDRTVEENVALPAIVSGLSARAARLRAAAALERVGLDASTRRARPSELSGGEQQRVALARAIINRPALLLVDEPTAHLDASSARHLIQLLEQFVIAGVTIIMASHTVPDPLPTRGRTLRLEAAQAVPS